MHVTKQREANAARRRTGAAVGALRGDHLSAGDPRRQRSSVQLPVAGSATLSEACREATPELGEQLGDGEAALGS